MATTIDPNAIFSGSPVSLTYGGVECGATISEPVVSLTVESGGPQFTNAGGPVKGTRSIRRVLPTVKVEINEITAQKLAWAMPGCVATSGPSVGQVVAGLSTTLAADPALGATTVSLTSVTTVNVNDFIMIGPAAPTAANSEVAQVTTVGTAGGGNTIVQNSAGGGLVIDHASAELVKTVTGTTLAASAAAGATNVKVVSVANLVIGDFLRVGYVGHYETRVLTAVGTAGPAGTGVTFAIPLTRDHALGEWAIEVTGLGSTVITWSIGIIGASSYADLVLTDIGADGRVLTATLQNAMSAENQSLTFSDDPTNPLGLALTFTGHYDPTTPRVVPFNISIAP